MKTTLMGMLLLLLGSTCVKAQGFHLGIKGGANITKVDGKAMSEEFNYGYNLGGFAEIGLGKKWLLQPEVMFNQYTTQTGTDFEDIFNNALPGSNETKVKLNYLSIPVLLGYRLTDWLSLNAGPQFGILMNSDKNLFENGEDAFKNGAVSLVGGAQVNIGAFRFSGRYFTNLNDINTAEVSNPWQNKGWQLSVGIKIL
ncbi:PorT family protein [Flavihumibacter rivuli]|uniref:porin family protein n=1 Tax=Flavihumibacter rivuli TaxID=2838156 RepID=UPI001BDF1985|nr:porin family protein [Flavihumibacter rivuli]ULQ57079.1 PorT family protein [Flavihumibacter rivuli]